MSWPNIRLYASMQAASGGRKCPMQTATRSSLRHGASALERALLRPSCSLQFQSAALLIGRAPNRCAWAALNDAVHLRIRPWTFATTQLRLGLRLRIGAKCSAILTLGLGCQTLKSELIWRTIFQTGTEAKLTIGRPE
jgi:hypothetical protein